MKVYDIEQVELQEQPAAVVRATLGVEELPGWFNAAYHTVAQFLGMRSDYPAGPPFARYHMVGPGRFEVEAGFPTRKPVEGDGEVLGVTLPAGPAARTVHVGPYDQMVPGYQALLSWVADHGGQPAGDAWEVYFGDPISQPDPETWRTQITQPYRPAR